MFNGADIEGWKVVGSEKWAVLEKGIVSTGVGRGALLSPGKYDHFRLLFSFLPLNPAGRQPSMLVLCRDGSQNFCAGIQFVPPGGGFWDYGPANAAAMGVQILPTRPALAIGQPGRCELIIHASAGTLKSSCCYIGNGTTCKTSPSTTFSYGSPFPKDSFGFMAHTPNDTVKWWDIFVEENPASDDFVTDK